jgi:dihydrofolate reductase
MINLIAAVSKNGVIGKDGVLPWRIPEDLRAFKELTMDGILFVGKKTASTLPPLKGRVVVKLDRTNYPTLLDINNVNWPGKQLWIIGGAEIYGAALELDIVDKIYITRIDQDYEGNTYFPLGKLIKYKLVSEKVLKVAEPSVILQEWSR